MVKISEGKQPMNSNKDLVNMTGTGTSLTVIITTVNPANLNLENLDTAFKKSISDFVETAQDVAIQNTIGKEMEDITGSWGNPSLVVNNNNPQKAGRRDYSDSSLECDQAVSNRKVVDGTLHASNLVHASSNMVLDGPGYENVIQSKSDGLDRRPKPSVGFGR
ncbi:hypothetical protein ACOSQ2_028667 [Xanthoceras sorbifolium]